MSNRYFKRAWVTVHRYYSIYILFIIIQHLCDRIGSDKIRLPVHNVMNKKNLSTSTKSIKDIEIINKISTLYQYLIFGSSFGYGFFKGKALPLYEPEQVTLFPKICNYMKEGLDAGKQAASGLGTCTLLELVKKLMFSIFVCIYSNKSIYKLHSVAATKNNDIYRKHSGMILWHI